MKLYSKRRYKGVFEIIQDYLKNMTRSKRQVNIISLVEQLERPGIKRTTNLKHLYYEERAEKYGF